MKALILLFLVVTVVVSDSAVDLSQEVKPQGTPLAIVQLGPKRSGPRTSYAVVSGFRDRRRMVIRDRETSVNFSDASYPELESTLKHLLS
jgi:hypothetical protein